MSQGSHPYTFSEPLNEWLQDNAVLGYLTVDGLTTTLLGANVDDELFTPLIATIAELNRVEGVGLSYAD